MYITFKQNNWNPHHEYLLRKKKSLDIFIAAKHTQIQ